MFSSLKSFIYSIKAHPLRGVLILLTITIGVATLSTTGGLSADINAALDSALAAQGRRITIVNGEADPNGQLEMQYQFKPDVPDILASEYEKLTDITTVLLEAWFKQVVWVGDKLYQIRSAVQVSESYAELMNLEMVEGRFFDKADVDARRRVVVISETAANMLYGSAVAALNDNLTIAARDGTLPYDVVGVYKDVSDLEREAYGIGDFILPLLTGILAEWKIHPIEKGAIIMARLSSDNLEKAEARIRAILYPAYGDDLALSVWEGVPNSNAPLIGESRNSVRNFAFAVNILGFIILVTSSIGIFSVMLVEVLNRTRDIGLRRALGTTKGGIRRFFVGQALYFSVIGGVLGTVLSIVVYRPIGNFRAPLFDSAGFRAADITLTAPGALPVAIAMGAAIVFGALFGFFPALQAARTPIIECIREEAA